MSKRFLVALLMTLVPGVAFAQGGVAATCGNVNYYGQSFHPGCLSWTDLNNSWSSPPPLGSVAPSAGNFTNLNVSGNLTAGTLAIGTLSLSTLSLNTLTTVNLDVAGSYLSQSTPLTLAPSAAPASVGSWGSYGSAFGGTNTSILYGDKYSLTGTYSMGTPGVAFSVTSSSGTGTVATLGYTGPSHFVPGDVITVTGNGAFNCVGCTVTAASANSVSYASAATGSTTGGSVGYSSTYLYRPELSPHVGYMYYSSGWNQDTADNAYRTGATYSTVYLYQNGQGDLAAYNFHAALASQRAGATNFLAQPAASGINGDMTALVNYVYENPEEYALSDTSAACSGTFTGSISGTALSVPGSVTGLLQKGMTLTGAGINAYTWIVSGSGTSWVVSQSQSVSSEAMTVSGCDIAMAGPVMDINRNNNYGGQFVTVMGTRYQSTGSAPGDAAVSAAGPWIGGIDLSKMTGTVSYPTPYAMAMPLGVGLYFNATNSGNFPVPVGNPAGNGTLSIGTDFIVDTSLTGIEVVQNNTETMQFQSTGVTIPVPLAVTNNASIGGTLGVTGAVTAPSFESANGTSLTISPGGNGKSITFGDGRYGIGVMGGMTYGATPSLASMIWNGTLQSQFFNTPGATYTLGSAALNPVVNVISNYAGTYTNSAFAFQNFFTIPSDTVDITGSSSGPMGVMALSQTLNTGARGGRNTFQVSQTIGSAITGDTTSQQYSSAGYLTYIQANVGGSLGVFKGSFYGAASQIRAYSGATYLQLVNAAGETDLSLLAGSSAQDVVGGTLILEGDHAVAGSRTNATFQVASQPGALGTWTNGYTYGGLGGPWPMASTATMNGTIQQIFVGNLNRGAQMPAYLATYGTDWSGINFSQQSGYAFNSAGFSVDGLGQGLFGGGLAITAVSTGYKIDVPNTFKVTSITVATAGNSAGVGTNNYYPQDIVYDASAPKGQYLITDTKVIAATVVAGGSGGTNGTQTVTGTTGTGTKFQASVTVAGGAITAVLSITTAGDYTANPTGVGKNIATGALNAEPVTGAGLTGATLNLGMGALTVSVLSGGVYNACPGAGGITPTGGSGSGLTLTPTCGTRDGITLAGASAKLGFYAAAPIAKATPTGACAGNTGCQALRDAMGNLGLINTGSITN